VKRFIPILLLIIVGLTTYLPSFSAKLFWDDDDFITKNEYVKNFQINKFFTAQAVEGSGKVSNYFRPLQFSIYALIYKLFGANPLAFHALSIFTHIAAAIAVYYFFLLLRHSRESGNLYGNKNISGKSNTDSVKIPGPSFAKASEGKQAGDDEIIAFFISLIFLVHPVQTEAVSYVSGFSDPLVTLFGFTTLIAFLHASHGNEARDLFPQSSRHGGTLEKGLEWNLILYECISLFFFIFTLLSKENGIIFAGIIFLLALYFHIYKERAFVRFFISVTPFLFVVLIYLLYHAHGIDVVSMKTLYGDHPYTNSLFVRISTFLSLLPTYIGILLFPNNLFYERDFTIHILTSSWNLTSFFVIATILGICTILILRCKLHVSSHKKDILQLATCSLQLFLFLSFFISFLPYTGLVLINGIMYEHFLYIPMIFFFAFVLIILFTFIPKKHFYLTLCLLSLVSCLLIARSWSRQYDWQDPIRFYQQTLLQAPNSFRVRNNLGMTYQEKGDIDAALKEYQKVIDLNPGIPNAYHNIGNLYFEKKDYKKAEEYFLQAISVDPYFGYSYATLMKIYQITGEQEKLQHISAEITKRFK
jgi:protein O-mannosyl-transferase